MSFEEKMRNFASRAASIKNSISTEEATKTSIIMPFFQILGYDVFNPIEFVPEFTADVGIKKGEKVDYAIFSDEKPVILIEAKSVNEELTKHDSQLFRYFATSEAKFAILTNGIEYKFYTDLEEPNKMDTSPFLELNIMEFKDMHLQELKKFHKENFSVENIFDTASELKYMGLIRSSLKEEFSSPSDDFIRFILGTGVYDGVKTQNVVDRYKPIVQRTVNNYINELVNDKIQNALIKEEEKSIPEVETEIEEADTNSLIVTTEEEMESYYIVKSILRDNIDSSRISFKDTQRYFGILIDNKVTRWVCRIYIRERTKTLVISTSSKDVIKYSFNHIDELYKYSDEIIARGIELTSS
jgi:hypothetical protein